MAEQRAEAMWRAQQEGETLEQIADRHGISRQRVHQIIHGVAPSAPRRPLSGPRRGAREGRGE